MCKGNLVLATLQMCLSHQNCRDFLQPNSSFDSLVSGSDLVSGSEIVYLKRKHLLRQKSKWWFHMIMLKMQKENTHLRLQTGKTQARNQSHGGNDPICFIAGAPSTPLSQNADIHHEEAYVSFRKKTHPSDDGSQLLQKLTMEIKLTIPSTRASCKLSTGESNTRLFDDFSQCKWWNEFKNCGIQKI